MSPFKQWKRRGLTQNIDFSKHIKHPRCARESVLHVTLLQTFDNPNCLSKLDFFGGVSFENNVAANMYFPFTAFVETMLFLELIAPGGLGGVRSRRILGIRRSVTMEESRCGSCVSSASCVKKWATRQTTDLMEGTDVIFIFFEVSFVHCIVLARRGLPNQRGR